MLFTIDDIRRRLRFRPFQPVRVVTSTDQHYDIFHPDLVMFGRRYLIIGTPSSDDAGVFENEARIALAHITELRNLPVPSPPATAPEQTPAS